MDPTEVDWPDMDSIDNRDGSGRSDIASDMGWVAPIRTRVRTDLVRVGSIWNRHRSDMDWLGRHGFHGGQLWVGSVGMYVLNGSTHAAVQSHSTLEVHSFPLGIRPFTLTIWRIP